MRIREAIALEIKILEEIISAQYSLYQNTFILNRSVVCDQKIKDKFSACELLTKSIQQLLSQVDFSEFVVTDKMAQEIEAKKTELQEAILQFIYPILASFFIDPLEEKYLQLVDRLVKKWDKVIKQWWHNISTREVRVLSSLSEDKENLDASRQKMDADFAMYKNYYVLLITETMQEMLLQSLCYQKPELIAWYMQERLAELAARMYYDVRSAFILYDVQQLRYKNYCEWSENFLRSLNNGQIDKINEQFELFIRSTRAVLQDKQLRGELALHTNLHIANFVRLFARQIIETHAQYVDGKVCNAAKKFDIEQLLEELEKTLASPSDLSRLLLFVIFYREHFRVEKLSEQQLDSLRFKDLPYLAGARFVQADCDDSLRQERCVLQCLPKDWEKQGYYVFGDIHASLIDLIEGITKVLVINSAAKFIFLGDFIDRGLYNFETLILLFLLFSKAPENVVFLIGNHEMELVELALPLYASSAEFQGREQLVTLLEGTAAVGDLYKQIIAKKATIFMHGGFAPIVSIGNFTSVQLKSGKILNFCSSQLSRHAILFFLLKIFENLPTMLLIGGNTLALHGGASIYSASLLELMYKTAKELVWSDYSRFFEQDGLPNTRGCGLYSGPSSIANKQQLGIIREITGHMHFSVSEQVFGVDRVVVNSNIVTADTACIFYINDTAVGKMMIVNQRSPASKRTGVMHIGKQFASYFYAIGETGAQELLSKLLSNYYVDTSGTSSSMYGEEEDYIPIVSKIIIEYLKVFNHLDASFAAQLIAMIFDNVKQNLLFDPSKTLSPLLLNIWCTNNMQAIIAAVNTELSLEQLVEKDIVGEASSVVDMQQDQSGTLLPPIVNPFSIWAASVQQQYDSHAVVATTSDRSSDSVVCTSRDLI